MNFTNQKDINDNEICEGDIVEFNPIGSEYTYCGKIVKYDSKWKIQVPKDGYEVPKRFYDLYDDVFGKAKIIKNI